MKCKECGKKLNKNEAFCTSCGAVQNAKSKSPNKVTIFIVVLAIISISTGTGAYLASMNSVDGATESGESTSALVENQENNAVVTSEVVVTVDEEIDDFIDSYFRAIRNNDGVEFSDHLYSNKVSEYSLDADTQSLTDQFVSLNDYFAEKYGNTFSYQYRITAVEDISDEDLASVSANYLEVTEGYHIEMKCYIVDSNGNKNEVMLNRSFDIYRANDELCLLKTVYFVEN